MSGSKSLPWKRLVRFTQGSGPARRSLIGQPVKDDLDVGLALRNREDVNVELYTGDSVLAPSQPTGTVTKIGKILSPIPKDALNLIRCIGLNYRQHAAETKMAAPKVPVMFIKPSDALCDPWPAEVKLPELTRTDDCGDYESELAVVIGKPGRDIPESRAMEHVLGFTAANDVSSRTPQFAQSQWNFSKGFDDSCPLGPTLVSPHLVPDPSKLRVRGILNGKVMQDCGTDDLIFSIPRLISFLSQGTTLRAGSIILTGTPAGVGFAQDPKVTIKPGDEFRVEISPFIGTLVSIFGA